MSDEEATMDPPFEMGKHHKKALVTLWHLYHGGRQTLTYDELSLRLGVGKKTKAWQGGAWKDLKGHEYIVSSPSDKKQFELSEKGVQLAATLMDDEELAEFAVPDTNETLHENIKKRVGRDDKARRYGGKILDLMLAPDYFPLNRHQMAAKFGTLADSHNFFYALKWHKDNGYVEFCEPNEIAELKSNKVSTVKEESESASTGDKKREASEDVDESDEPPKKKKCKSTKKRSGGKPLKLSKKAFVHPPQSVEVESED